MMRGSGLGAKVAIYCAHVLRLQKQKAIRLPQHRLTCAHALTINTPIISASPRTIMR